MTGDLRLRRAFVADASSIAHVHRLSRASYYGTEADPGDGREAMWAGLVAGSGQSTWLALDGRRVVGFIAVVRTAERPLELELAALYVLPDAFGSGVGSRLHDRYLGDRRDGEEGVLEVWAGNGRAISFYVARGWVATTLTRSGPGELDFVTYRLPPSTREVLER